MFLLLYFIIVFFFLFVVDKKWECLYLFIYFTSAFQCFSWWPFFVLVYHNYFRFQRIKLKRKIIKWSRKNDKAKNSIFFWTVLKGVLILVQRFLSEKQLCIETVVQIICRVLLKLGYVIYGYAVIVSKITAQKFNDENKVFLSDWKILEQYKKIFSSFRYGF